MKKILLTFVIILTLQGCSAFRWVNNKSYELGESMPVSDSVERCEGRNFCW